MNYLVCIKQTPDTTTRIQITQDQKSVDLSGVKWIISPYDEFALEEALRFKEKDLTQGISSHVVVCSAGPPRVKEALRTALAMGADKGVHILAHQFLDSLSMVSAVSSILEDYLKTVDVVFCGKHSIDWSFSAFGPMLAEVLGWPSVSPVHKVQRLSNALEVHRSFEGGEAEVLEIQGPVVLCVNKGINQPRFPSLPQIMKAKSKPLESFPLSDSIENSINIESLEHPKERPPVQMIEGSPEEQARKLVQILRDKEGLV